MSKHTPGPWQTEWRRGHRVFVEHDNGDELSRDLIARVSGPEANGHLIAAAPDLLSALKGVIAVADRKTTEFDAARAAIAKAEHLPRRSPSDG